LSDTSSSTSVRSRVDSSVESPEGCSFDWRSARYPEWNQRLLDYFLRRSLAASVERIPATPEELPSAVGDPTAPAEEVVQSFIAAVREELPDGVSFCRYCFRRRWTPTSREPPYFFGMLWFTCLLASGYPASGGSFRDRFRDLIGTDDQCRHGKDQRGCLSELWESVAAWCEMHEGYAKLILPPEDERLVVIGRSYYLAFPTRSDRRILLDVLTSEELVGFEPPILPVVRALDRERERFGHDFRSALDHFLDYFLRDGRDPRDSAFWRAIREEAIDDRTEAENKATSRGPGLTFVATWDDDETLLLRLSAVGAAEIAGAITEPLPVTVADATHYFTDETGEVDPIAEAALRGRLPIAGALGPLIRQGVLVFIEEIAGEYKLARGEEIEGAELALVRRDRVGAFAGSFGGVVEESRFADWLEVAECRVRQLPELPPGLERVTQMLLTTSAPVPRVVGGIRLAGGFLWSPFIPPEIRSPTALEVSCRTDGSWLPCSRPEDAADWVLPCDLRVAPPMTVEVRALFEVDFLGHTVRRETSTSFRFLPGGTGCTYKRVGAGYYWREGCNPEESGHRGGEILRLAITTEQESGSSDLLELDPSLRYLGPGLGEMSTEMTDSHEWLALGPRKAPHDSIFVGDLDNPTAPNSGESVDKGDRRNWSFAFKTGGPRVTARIGAKYVAPSEDARLGAILSLYRRRASRQLDVGPSRPCPAAQLEGCWFPETAAEVSSTDAAMHVVEAVAAFGHGRSGIALKEFLDLIGRMTGGRDALLCQQIVQAWAEAGLIDLLRRQDRSQTVVVPRVPRFVVVRRGPCVEARLVGLAAADLVSGIESLSEGTFISRIQPTTRFQPPLLRISGVEPERIGEISRNAGLAAPEWVSWPSANTSPPYLRVRDDFAGVSHGRPPEAYRFDALWDWNDMVFRPHPRVGPPRLVEVERRRHPQRCAIYVVLVDGDPMFWCHFRTWALLRAAELCERPSFRLSKDGAIRSRGFAPMHLPLPFGRLCAVMGVGLPGPEIQPEGRVGGYVYPFGPRVHSKVLSLMPRPWFEDAGGEG
jgi:hypothetical protein